MRTVRSALGRSRKESPRTGGQKSVSSSNPATESVLAGSSSQALIADWPLQLRLETGIYLIAWQRSDPSPMLGRTSSLYLAGPRSTLNKRKHEMLTQLTTVDEASEGILVLYT